MTIAIISQIILIEVRAREANFMCTHAHTRNVALSRGYICQREFEEEKKNTFRVQVSYFKDLSFVNKERLREMPYIMHDPVHRNQSNECV